VDGGRTGGMSLRLSYGMGGNYAVQGNLAHKKATPPRTLKKAYA
jgi:hypothetical protein